MNQRYFSHDFDAFGDPKIQSVVARFGVAGYGAFWYIVERLYQNDGILPLSQVDAIAYALHLECKCIASIIQEFNLFENDGKNFWSNSVNERVERMKRVSESRRRSSLTRWNSANSNDENESNANALQMDGKYKYKRKIDIKESNKEKTGETPDAEEPKIDYSHIVELWVSNCPNLAKPTKMTDTRRAKLRTRLAEMGKTRDEQMTVLEQVFKKIGESSFCNGENNRGWKADFDWIISNDSNWVKVIENKYANNAAGGASNVNDIWHR